MVGLSDKASESEEIGSSNSKSLEGASSPAAATAAGSSSGVSSVKTCADCGTTRTPLWRGGPAGPKSLCNACGIRSRKKRRALLGLNKEDKKSKRSSNNNVNNNQKSSGSKLGSGDSLKKKLLEIGREVVLQRPRSNLVGRRRRKLGEVEQAAFLLMALSCGSVYA